MRRQRPPTKCHLLSRPDRTCLPSPLDQPMDPGPAHLVFRGDTLRIHARVLRSQYALAQIHRVRRHGTSAERSTMDGVLRTSRKRSQSSRWSSWL